jgi:hypothetical protein
MTLDLGWYHLEKPVKTQTTANDRAEKIIESSTLT